MHENVKTIGVEGMGKKCRNVDDLCTKAQANSFFEVGLESFLIIILSMQMHRSLYFIIYWFTKTKKKKRRSLGTNTKLMLFDILLVTIFLKK